MNMAELSHIWRRLAGTLADIHVAYFYTVSHFLGLYRYATLQYRAWMSAHMGIIQNSKADMSNISFFLPCSKSLVCIAAAFAASASLDAASFANGNFGRQQSWKVDAAVYAQPLFAPGTSLSLNNDTPLRHMHSI